MTSHIYHPGLRIPEAGCDVSEVAMKVEKVDHRDDTASYKEFTLINEILRGAVGAAPQSRKIQGFRKNCVCSQFTATPSSPSSL